MTAILPHFQHNSGMIIERSLHKLFQCLSAKICFHLDLHASLMSIALQRLNHCLGCYTQVLDKEWAGPLKFNEYWGYSVVLLIVKTNIASMLESEWIRLCCYLVSFIFLSCVGEMGDKGQKGSIGRHGKIGPIGSKGMLSSIVSPFVFQIKNLWSFLFDKRLGAWKMVNKSQSLP